MSSDSLSILKDYLEIDQKELSFREFVESPEYLGNSSVYEFWKREMGAVPDDVTEIIFDGSLGTGKSYVAAIYMCYRLCKLFKKGNPQAMFGLAPGSDVYVMYFSLSMTLAKRTGFQYLFEVVDSCEWFKKNCPRNTRLTSEIEFPNGFHIIYASAAPHQTGLNVWGFILDEANFRKGVGLGMAEEYSEVFEICNQLIDRQMSRFLVGGKLEALAIFVSSASYESSFIEKRKDVARSDSRTKIVTSVKYKVKPENYSSETFEVFCGYGQMEPCIIDTQEQKISLISSLGFTIETCEHLFEKVPVTLRKQFLSNINLAIQNHCGRPTNVKGTFLHNYGLLKSSYTEIKSPFLQDFITISNKDTSQIMDIFDPSRIENGSMPHALFLDLSIQGDSGSLACFRYDGIKDSMRLLTHCWTLEIVPPEFPEMTMIHKVTEFVIWLSQYVNIVAFGSDNFQSVGVRQDICNALTLTDIRMSMDSSDAPYLHWIKALVEKRVRMKFYERFDREVREAQHDLKKRRVVKRPDSSDDQLQATIGAFYLADTFVAAEYEGIQGLYENDRVNLIGGKSITSVLRKLGYTQS